MHVIHTNVSTHISSADDSITGDTNSIMCDTNVGVCSPYDNVICVSGNLRGCEGYAESGDQPPLLQVRKVLQPLDNKLENHPIFTYNVFLNRKMQ